MQSPERPLTARNAYVILAEIRLDPRLPEILAIPGLKEIPAVICVHVCLYEKQILYVRVYYFHCLKLLQRLFLFFLHL